MTGYNPNDYFNEVQAVNFSGATAEDVIIRVVNTQKTLSGAEVARYAMCDERFGRRNYRRQVIDLNWIDGSGSPKSQ